MKNKAKGKIFIISGPSGSGKTTLYRKLLETTDSLVKTISVTTRSRRSGERNGRDYFFVSEKMFTYKKRAGHFLESQKVFDNHYGTPQKAVRDLLSAGQNVLLCIDVKGAKVVCRKFPKAIRIFIKTPSLEVLKKRLKQRDSESEESLELRLNTAKEELKEAGNYDYVVINGNLAVAGKKLKEIIQKEVIKY